MSLTLCVPVLNRYDCLKVLLRSLEGGTVSPTKVCIIDNGQSKTRIKMATADCITPLDIFVPNERMGVAKSWNWFIENIGEERLIVNDDLAFEPESIEKLVSTPGPVVSPLSPGTNAFSCFIIRDQCVHLVGLFDETISPGYAYFEDCDYYERMLAAGIDIARVECPVQHKGSSTIKAFLPSEAEDHHRKFKIARANFIKKWGATPQELQERREKVSA